VCSTVVHLSQQSRVHAREVYVGCDVSVRLPFSDVGRPLECVARPCHLSSCTVCTLTCMLVGLQHFSRALRQARCGEPEAVGAHGEPAVIINNNTSPVQHATCCLALASAVRTRYCVVRRPTGTYAEHHGWWVYASQSVFSPSSTYKWLSCTSVVLSVELR
jgi:hypothetical protein